MPSFQRLIRAGFLSAVSALALTAGSQASAATLQEALVEAYNSNPALLAERANLRATDEELAQANAGWRPSVSINGSASSSTNYAGVGQSNSNAWNASISARQPLYEGGRVSAQRDLAKAQIRAGRARLTGTESNILLSTVTAYTDVVRDLAVVDLSRRQVEVLSRERQASQDRFDVGEITRTDVSQAEARLSGARTSLISSQAQLEASRAAYIRIIGRPPADLERAPPLPRLPDSLAEAIDSALLLNPSLVAARESQLASEAAIDLATSALLPNVNLEAQYSRGGSDQRGIFANPDTDQASIGIGASVPLYQGGGEYASIRQAKQTNSQNRLLATQTEREAIEDVTNAWEGLVAARASISSAQDQVRASEIAYEGVRQEADVGARTTLDVLNAEQELLNARVTLITNQRNEYVAAYALLAAMGRLTAADLGLPVEVYDPVVHAEDVDGQLIGVGGDD
jgi:TolC family type I secretion outer membrane protein